MEGFKSQGSFGVPEAAKQRLEQARVSAKIQEPPAAKKVEHEIKKDEEAPKTGAVLSKDDSDEVKRQVQLDAMKAAYEKELGITITEDDVRDYIFKGRLVKADIKIVPGYLEGTIQTLNVADSGAIDERMASFRDKGKFTAEGLDNERAILILAYAWKSALKTGDAAARSLGDTVEARDKSIRNMGAHVVDAASYANTGLNFLLKYALREKSFVKKS